jgi:hypothetical protein
MTRRAHVSQKAFYQIKVQGRLETETGWEEWLNGMTASFEEDPAHTPVTVFTGPVRDQAALRGIVNKLWNMNLTLLSLNRLEEHHD